MLHNATILLTGLTSKCCTGMCKAVPERLQPNPRTRELRCSHITCIPASAQTAQCEQAFDAQIDHHIELAQLASGFPDAPVVKQAGDAVAVSHLQRPHDFLTYCR